MRCMFPNCKCDLEGNDGHVCPEGMEGISPSMLAERDCSRKCEKFLAENPEDPPEMPI